MDNTKWLYYMRKMLAPMGPCNQGQVSAVLARTFKGPFLEIGAGVGAHVQKIVESQGVEYTGTDLFADNKMNVDAHDLSPFDDGQFKTIFMSNVFEHLVAPLVALWECNRVMSMGGTLIVGLPNGAGHKVAPEHVAVYDHVQMEHFFQLSGFALISVWEDGEMKFYIAEKNREES